MVPGLDDPPPPPARSPSPGASENGDRAGGPSAPPSSGRSSSSDPTTDVGAAVAAERLAQVAGLARPPSTPVFGGVVSPAVPPSVVVPLEDAAETGAAPPVVPTATTIPSTPTTPSAPAPPSTRFSFREFAYLCGPGLLMAVAYLDPGNLEADIQAGANVGYTLLWFFFCAFGAGALFQGMTARLGIVTGRDLARLCGDAYPKPARILLWALIEVALVGADIQETIGSALAISLLSGGRVPLWGGCVLVTASAFLVLLLERCGARHLEAVFGGLIALQGGSAAINYVQAGVPQRDVLKGLFIPRLPPPAVPYAVGALGALIMPHNIYFASAIVNARSAAEARAAAKAGRRAAEAAEKEKAKAKDGEGGGGQAAPAPPPAPPAAEAKTEVVPAPAPPAAEAKTEVVPAPAPPASSRRRRRRRSSTSGSGGPRPLPASPVAGPARTRVLLTYVRLETAGVLAVAFAINLFIVCLFAYGFYGTPEAAGVGLETAGTYLGNRFGASFKYLWGVGLLASGQSATISLTYAGQIVMAGLLRFEVSGWKRLIGTRAVSLVPTLAVAAAYEGARRFDAMNQLLNILQAMVLPFSLVPCIAMARSAKVMSPGFRTNGVVYGVACGIAGCVAAVDGYLMTSFFKDLMAKEDSPAVPAGAWAGFGLLLTCYYGLIAYFAVGPRRAARAWTWVRGRVCAAAAAAREAGKGTRWSDPGAMMEVHF
jgi:Mn2+/Fe2+ NRAMP family transporter